MKAHGLSWLDMKGRLNSFQKTMLEWNGIHPYSAIHVAQIRGLLDAMRLRSCLSVTLEARGLTHLTLDRENGTFQYLGGAADCEIRTLCGEEDPRQALVAEVERQLNQPFALAERFCPFRFFVAPAGDSFFLGLVYFHPAADAESVALLLKEMVNSYAEGGTPGSPDSLDLYPDDRAHLLSRHPTVVARRLLALPSQVGNLRQSHRPGYRDADNLDNGFVCFSVAPEDLRALVDAGKSWDVTVNDLLMALLLKALSPLAASRRGARKRRKISVGCIVNLRRDLGVDSRRTFGLFLGSFTVTHEVQDGIGLRELARDIRQQTSPIKRHKLYLGTPLELGVARFMLKRSSPARRKKFYPKNYPLWGGITNMNLNSLWEQRDKQAPLDYFRGVSTGPVTPLVLSVTTIYDRANMALSYRSTVFSQPDIQNIVNHFMGHLKATREEV